MNTHSRNYIWIIWVMTFCNGLIFYAPVFALYLHQELLNFTQVALIMALQSGFIILLEIPSGAFADIFGRKKSLIIGAILHLVSLSYLYIGTNFFILFLFAVFSALVQSLNSGTITAIIFDSVKLSSSDARDSNKFLNRIKFKQIIAINGALWPISASLASLIGGFLSPLGYRITILITFAPSFLQLAAVLMIKEPEYSKLERTY